MLIRYNSKGSRIILLHMCRDTHLLKVEFGVSELGMLTKHFLLVGILVGVGRWYSKILD